MSFTSQVLDAFAEICSEFVSGCDCDLLRKLQPEINIGEVASVKVQKVFLILLFISISPLLLFLTKRVMRKLCQKNVEWNCHLEKCKLLKVFKFVEDG
jgi:hypothetical protein